MEISDLYSSPKKNYLWMVIPLIIAIILLFVMFKPSVCNPNFECSDWSECSEGQQTRTCVDTNSCKVNPEDLPVLSKECGFCVPNWECTSWSDCNTNLQTRTCIDSNTCGESSGKPVESKSCQSNQIITTTTSCGGVECNDPTGEGCDLCLSDCSVCYPNRIKSSDYGVYRLYIASSIETGLDLEDLKEISEVFRRRVYIASEGVLNNFEFYYDPLSSDFYHPYFENPDIKMYDMTSAYYFDNECTSIPAWTDYQLSQTYSEYDYNPQLFSFASVPPQSGLIIPEGVTCPTFGVLADTLYGYHDTLHEFGHTVGCADDTGNIMRCIEGLCDFNKYPPNEGGIDTIEKYIKNGIIRLK